MRSITLYNYNELSDEAKSKAIEEVKEEMEENEGYEAARWAIDDCSLLEPPHSEMAKILGEDYYERNGGQFVFKNVRTGLEFDDYSINISDALVITNDTMFKTWLGIPEIFHEKVTYDIIDATYTEIYFEHNLLNADPRFNVIETILESANSKFTSHVINILRNIESSVEEYFSEDNVEERILGGDYEFTESGELYSK